MLAPQTMTQTDAGPLSLPLAVPLLSNAAGDSMSPIADTAAPEADSFAQSTANSPSKVIETVALADQPSLLATAIVEPSADSPLITEAEVAEAVESAQASVPTPIETQQWIEHNVAKGESLARIFADQSLSAGLLHRIVNSGPDGEKLARIRPGQQLRFLFDGDHELQRIELHRNRVESLRIAITDDTIKFEEISKNVDKRVASAAGVIESSLFVDGQAAGMSDGQIMEMAEIFGWDIDFALEIRSGDQFRVLYEEHYLDGEKLRDGPILAAEFTNRGTVYRAVRYEDNNGEVGYYDDNGASKRRAFIRTPIKFARVSSRYNPRRWHPVLKRWRSHKGVDYAAPRGTPIRATGDGRIVFRGTKSGYGKTVIIEHAGRYTTLYAHMKRFSKRSARGKRVKQGQVIGYVGSTGLATGPHLHYEFRVGGKHRDPLRVKLPKSLKLAKSELPNFRSKTSPLLTQLAAIPAGTLVASADATLTN